VCKVSRDEKEGNESISILAEGQCEAEHPWAVCEYCKKHPVKDLCLKAGKAEPSRQLPTADDANIPHEECLLLEYLYHPRGLAQTQDKWSIVFPYFIGKLGALLGPAIGGSPVLRDSLLALACFSLSHFVQLKFYLSRLSNIKRTEFYPTSQWDLLVGAYLISLLPSLAPDNERLYRLGQLFDLHKHDWQSTEAPCFVCTLKPYMFRESFRKELALNETPFVSIIMNRFQPSEISYHFSGWGAPVDVLCGGQQTLPSDLIKVWEYLDHAVLLLTTMLRHLARKREHFLTREWTELVTQIVTSVRERRHFPDANLPSIDKWFRSLMSIYVLLLSSLITAPDLISGIQSKKSFLLAALFAQFSMAIAVRLSKKFIACSMLCVVSLIILDPTRPNAHNGILPYLGAENFRCCLADGQRFIGKARRSRRIRNGRIIAKLSAIWRIR
jgi:hypothetical protein